MRRLILVLMAIIFLGVNSVPAPTNDGGGGGGGGCPSGHLTFSQEIATCGVLPFLYLTQESVDQPMCPSNDIWIYLLRSSSYAGHNPDWDPVPDSFSGEITYNSTYLQFTGYSMGYVDPASTFSYISPGHLSISVVNGVPAETVSPPQWDLVALHFQKIGSTIPNPRVDLNLFPVMCHYPNGNYLECDGYGTGFCEAGGTVRQTP